MPEPRTVWHPGRAGESSGTPGRVPRWMSMLACVALAACAAGRADAPLPTPLLSSSVDAEKQVRSLIAAWARGGRAERVAMERSLLTFRDRYRDDDASRLVEVLLAWIALEKGDLPQAEARAHQIRSTPGPGSPGSMADLAAAVEGAALRRQGHPDQALALLSPLVSKLVDPWARSLCNQESVESAVQSGHWDRALGLMRVWLREAGPEERARGALERRARPGEGAADRAPRPARPAGATRPLPPRRRRWRCVGSSRGASPRWLNAARTRSWRSTCWRRRGSCSAIRGTRWRSSPPEPSRARVEARTVGLVLSLRNDRTRRRGADIAEGVSFGLGLPGSAARLVSRDDHGSPERLDEALAALSADGASILIAGSDEQEATQAAAFAEAHHIPVLLLRPPARDVTGHVSRFSFVVGADPVALETSLVAALVTRGAAPVAILADEPAHARTPHPDVIGLRACNEAGVPWKGVGAAGVVLEAGQDCARDAIAAAAPLRLRFAVGFESDTLVLPPGSVVATAGIFPFGPTPSPPIGAWLRTHPGPPSWWAALGHDAAVLAWAGVQGLPARGTEDPAEVEARRAQAAAALAAAQASLWTTEAQGFRGSRTLPRTLGVREIPPAGRP